MTIIFLFTMFTLLSLAQGYLVKIPRTHVSISKAFGTSLFAGRSTSRSDLASRLDQQFEIFLFEARQCALAVDTSLPKAKSYLSILANLYQNDGTNLGISDDNEHVFETISLLRAKVEGKPVAHASYPIDDDAHDSHFNASFALS